MKDELDKQLDYMLAIIKTKERARLADIDEILVAAKARREKRRKERESARQAEVDAILEAAAQLVVDELTVKEEDKELLETAKRLEEASTELRRCTICKEVKTLDCFSYVTNRGVYIKMCKICQGERASRAKIKALKEKNETIEAGRKMREEIEAPLQVEKMCRICLTVKPLVKFMHYKYSGVSDGKLHYSTMCRACYRKVNVHMVKAGVIAYKAGYKMPCPIIMNPDKPEKAVVDKWWLIEPEEELHWELNTNVVKNVLPAMHNIPLLMGRREEHELLPEYEQKKQIGAGNSDAIETCKEEDDQTP
jgi:hypothetical protein